MTAKDYQREARIHPLREPTPDRVVLAVDIQGFPKVWAASSFKVSSDNVYWIVTNDPHGRSYMFKEDGLFGYTDDRRDRLDNAFTSLEAAIECFRSFYK